MGTTYSVVIPNQSLKHDNISLAVKIEAVLNRVNQQMSTYLPTSDLSLFNHSSSTTWFELPKPLVQLVIEAESISKKTQGAYDITIAPVVNLWGFGSIPDKPASIPDTNNLQSVMQQVGYKKLNIREQPPSLKKDTQGLQIDLSSIAKGYAVDQIGELLETQGIANYLVEIGGELRTRGNSPRNDPWRVAIETPDVNGAKVQQALRLNDTHIATSGDYRNYFEKDGIRYSHTIDARNGQPVSHHLASVTVMHQSTAKADAWATALMVLGEKAGYETALENHIAAYFVYRQQDNFKVKYTTQFNELLEAKSE